jgi:hypothetical protein
MPKRLRKPLRIVAVCVGLVLIFPAGLEAVRDPGSSPPQHSAVHADLTLPKGTPSFAVAARRSVVELMGTGDHSPVQWKEATGLWGGHIKANWWESALAVFTLVRYAERTHFVAPAFQAMLDRIYARNIYKPYSTARQEFANEFMDDTGWWGLAWLAASRYELADRHDVPDAAKYLAVAEWDGRYINDQPRPCGGIEWAMRRPADTITSAEFVDLAASLSIYRDRPGIFYDPVQAKVWRWDALRALRWLRHKGLISESRGHVYNGVNGRCRVIGGPMTYSEGEVARALTQLGTAFHDPRYYRHAARFLRFTLNPAHGLISGGVLQERCEGTPGSCASLPYHLDLPSYKGLFVNAVLDWSETTGSHEFDRFLRDQATAVLANAVRTRGNRPARCQSPQTCQFAFRWIDTPDPRPIGVTVGGQESAIDALTAVLPPKT